MDKSSGGQASDDTSVANGDILALQMALYLPERGPVFSILVVAVSAIAFKEHHDVFVFLWQVGADRLAKVGADGWL